LKLGKKELILFDFDGTLIDSVPDLVFAINEMQSQLNREHFEEQLVRSWVGNGAQTLVKRALSKNVLVDEALDQKLFEKALAIFLESYKKNVCVKTKTYEGVVSTLHLLQKRGYKMAIVTNKPHNFVAPILEQLGLNDFFALFIGGDALEYKKPHPQPLEYICQEMNVSIVNAVMVGDSKNDILAANAANMQSIAVSYGYNYEEDISIYNPTVVIDHFRDILEVLS